MVASPFEQRQGEFNRVIVPESADNLRAVAVLDANLPHERIVGKRHVKLNVRLFLQSAVCDFRVGAEFKSLISRMPYQMNIEATRKGMPKRNGM